MEKKWGISQELLKGIACVTMFLDHFAILVNYNVWFRVIGRLAFPIYCYLISEGIRHTRNPARYFGRLFIMAVLTEPIYDRLLYPFDGIWSHQNVLWTLLLGAIMLEAIRRAADKPWRYLLIVPFALAAEALHCSYGGAGILMIALFGVVRDVPGEKGIWLVGMLLCNAIAPSYQMPIFGVKVPIQLFAVFSLVPICLYSGKKRTGSRVISWAFYLFYPLHLLALYGIQRLLFG